MFSAITRRDRLAPFDDILSGGNWVTGLAIGVGAVVILPLAAPILRPLAKTAIKGGILAYQGATELVEGISGPRRRSCRGGRRGADAGRGCGGHWGAARDAVEVRAGRGLDRRNPGRGERRGFERTISVGGR